MQEPKTNLTRLEQVIVIATVVFIVWQPIAWVARSKIEAMEYNRLTGARVTTWQAMFVEFRIEGNVNERKAQETD